MGRWWRAIGVLAVVVILFASAPGLALAKTPGGTSTACHDDGFWKAHPDAWPVETVYVGGAAYTKTEAISILRTPTKGDMTYVMWREVLSAQLNLAAVPTAPYLSPHALIEPLEFLTHYPLGSGVAASSETWAYYSAAAARLDSFNNWRP